MDKFEIIPESDFVLIKTTKIDVSNTKIFIPDIGGEKPVFAEVIAVGTGKYSEFADKVIPMRFKAGDIVISPAFGGRVLKINGTEYTIINQDSLMAKVNINK